MAKRTSKKCPTCGKANNVVRILYGIRSPNMFEKHEAGKIKLGGCEIGGNDPQLYCTRCNQEFWYPQDEIEGKMRQFFNPET